MNVKRINHYVLDLIPSISKKSSKHTTNLTYHTHVGYAIKKNIYLDKLLTNVQSQKKKDSL